MVRQDSGELRSIAAEIDEKGTEFLNAKTAMFDEMEAKLKASEDTGAAWYGPKAAAFLAEFKAKEDDFTNAYNNIVQMAENLKAQAEAWENFENV